MASDPMTTATAEMFLCQRDEARTALAAVTAERDDAVRERDEMRGANITPEDAERPYGQSVEYWQDRALDHATHADHRRIELVAAIADRDTLLEAIDALQQNAGVDHVRRRQALYNAASAVRDRGAAERTHDA